MAELVKPWNDGGSLSATYEGSGDGSAIFSSDSYEGIDRVQPVIFRDGGNTVVVERKVKQVGVREPIVTADGLEFKAKDDQYGVVRTDFPVEGCRIVEYLEASGTQYIDLGITFDNTDECYAEAAMLTSVTDKFFISPVTWNTKNNRYALGGIYNGSFDVGYGGNTTGTTMLKPTTPYDTDKHIFTYKDKVFKMEDMGCQLDVSNISWGGETAELRLFYGNNKPTECRIYRYWQKRDGNLIIDLIPILDSNNVACLYDRVRGRFLYNGGSGQFIVGKI